MPIYRDADGKIVEEKTDKSSGKTGPTSKEGDLPPVPPSAGRQATGQDRLEAPTRKMDESRLVSSAGDEKTRLVGGRRRQADRDRLQEQADKTDAMDDPIVGWLVIIEGPGKGRPLKLGYGANSIGRGETNRISLNFGDDQISRDQHSTVTYDPRGKKFYVQQGSGTNLTYLNDQPVLTPTELSARNSPTTGIAGSLNEAPQWGACGLLPMVNITDSSTLVALPPVPALPVHECTPTPVPPVTQPYSRSTPSTRNSTP